MRALLILAMLLLASVEAEAAKRVALIIGNSAYQNTAVLRNPKNDAEDFGAALKRLGFDVLVEADLDKRRMERTIRQFGENMAGADVALFFFAGHGFQVTGQNYLLPIDARLASENDVDFEAISLNLIVKQMEREAKASLVLLDACRDNPLARNLARSMGTRSSSIGQGLAEVKTGVGTLIGFSTQPGNVALDGAGRNSPYAGALLKHVEVPGRDISATLINVRNDVVTATAGKQVPWEHTSLMAQIVLRPATAATPASSPARGTVDKEMELSFWNSIKESKSPELLQAYIDRYPNGTFTGLARVMIELAARERAAQRKVSDREMELERAERARMSTAHATELAKAQEEARKAREALSNAERERDQARASVEAAQKQLSLETSKLTGQSVAGASIAPPTPTAPIAPPPKSQPTIEVDADLVRKIKRELNRVGCTAGKEDNEWNAPVITALRKYNQAATASLPVEAAAPDTLKSIAAKTDRVCPLECRDGEKVERGRCVAIAPPPAADKAPVPKAKPVEKAPPPKKATETQECAAWKYCLIFKSPAQKGQCGLQPLGCQ